MDGTPGDGGHHDGATARIVTVCTANIARSPLAAAMLRAQAERRLGPDAPVVIASCGVRAAHGRPAARGSQLEALERDLSLADHHSIPAADAGLEDADLILTMTEEHRSGVLRLLPDGDDRTFTLPELARLVDALPLADALAPVTRIRTVAAAANAARAHTPPADRAEDVEDPVGGASSGYAAMAARLEELVATVARHLFGPADDSGR